MSILRIADDLALPVEFVTSATAVLGVRGSGKTYGGKDIVEESIKAGIPVAIVDPLGVWWGLKSSADGKHAGLPVYILGGAHADVPIEPTGGAVVARFVIEKRVPVVIDLSQMRKGQRSQFVVDYAETLFHLNRDPLLAVFDEVAQFCPQSLTGRPELAFCVGAIEDLVTLGRARGLGALLGALIDSYPHSLTKDDLGERSGYSASSGHFANVLGRLRTMKLAEGHGEIRAARALFE